MATDQDRVDGGELRSRYEALLRLSNAIAAHASLEALFKELLPTLRPVLPFDCLALALYDEADNAMRPLILEPDTFPRLPPIRSVPVAEGPAGWVWQSQQTRVIRPGVDPEQAIVLDFARDVGIRVTCWLPLTTARTRLGVLVFGRRDADQYGTQDIALMEQIATQIAVAVENALGAEALAGSMARVLEERDALKASERERERLLHDRIERVKELTALHQAAELLQRGDLPTAEALARIADLLPPAFQYPEVTAARVSYGDARFATTHYRETTWKLVTAFQTGDGSAGMLEVVYLEERPLSAEGPFLAEERRLLDSLADMLQSTLDRSLAEQALRVSEERLQLLLDINNLVVSELDYKGLLRVISEALRKVVPHDYAGVAVFDADTRQLLVEAWTSERLPLVTNRTAAVSLDGSPAGIAFQRGTPMVFRGPEIAAFGDRGAPILIAAGMKSVCFVPLVTRRGTVGVLGVASADAEGFPSAADMELLQQVSGQIAIGVENAVAYQAMTGLKNKLAEEKHYLEDEIRLEHDFSEVVGKSAAMRAALRAVETVAPTDSTVLLLGETGTGKELLARAIHNLSPRRSQTFVRLNGAALPAHLIESELFGYEKGAFTGATTSRMGRLELAHRGTLFLDEVGDVPVDLQAKLLRVLQEREFERLGSNRTQRVDIRLIAATNRDLPQMIADGDFRTDLYYRLNVFPVQVPPLRDRREEIPALVDHFVQRYARRMNRTITRVPEATRAALMQWDWPGNIRELQNVIERAVILTSGGTLQLPADLFQTPPARTPGAAPAPATLERAEREAILTALRSARGVVAGPAGAAALLGLKRTTLQARMRKLGITRPAWGE